MQLGLNFEPPRARRRDPQTSQRAASRVQRFASGHFAAILTGLETGPGNYRQIAERAGLEPVAVARRMNELEQAGLVRRDGEEGGFTRWAKS